MLDFVNSSYLQSPNAIPFAQASYTLRVFDERGINAIATAGYFNGANSIVQFAMYSPAAYTPLANGRLPSLSNRSQFWLITPFLVS